MLLTTHLALDEPAAAVVRMLRYRAAQKDWVTLPFHFGPVLAAT